MLLRDSCNTLGTMASETPHQHSVPQPYGDSREPRLHHDAMAMRTVFIAPKRADRPCDVGSQSSDLSPASLGDSNRPIAGCPFCAGNESLAPPDVLRLPDSLALPWNVRIIPNRFPVVEDCRPPGAISDAISGQMNARGFRAAHGVHDVLIESPLHDRTILSIQAQQWRDAWELCRRRIEAFAERGDLAWATVFKNSGPRAGASLEHLHSQLVALDFVPPTMAEELAAARRTADPFGEMLRQAETDGRIVTQSGDLVAIVPVAPRQPFETWIVPRTPEPYFHSTSPSRLDALADLTQRLIGALDRLVPGADYNWWLHQAPFAAACHAGKIPSNWHWHLEILPRLASLAGFELGTGCHITTFSAEDSARRLREASSAVETGLGVHKKFRQPLPALQTGGRNGHSLP